MISQQTAWKAGTEKDTLRAQQDDRLMETLSILADGGTMTRELLNQLLSQYSWDGYVNELEFE